MDANTALFVLDQLSSGQAASSDDVQNAANTLSHYVGFLELLSPARTVTDARNMLALLDRRKKKVGLQYAVVSVLGDDFIVGDYDPDHDPAAFRLAEKELSRILRLRFNGDQKVVSLQMLADVIGGRA
jgi:hypothetical protein